MALQRKDSGETAARDSRRAFLEASQAYPTPRELWTIWCALWIAQGGHYKISEQPFGDTEYVELKSNCTVMPLSAADALGLSPDDYRVTDPMNVDRSIRTVRYWTPTVGGQIMPEGYGSNSLRIVAVDAVAPVYGVPYTDRRGWEYGHSELFVIEGTDEFKATTNSTRVTITRDIAALALRPNAVANCIEDIRRLHTGGIIPITEG